MQDNLASDLMARWWRPVTLGLISSGILGFLADSILILDSVGFGLCHSYGSYFGPLHVGLISCGTWGY